MLWFDYLLHLRVSEELNKSFVAENNTYKWSWACSLAMGYRYKTVIHHSLIFGKPTTIPQPLKEKTTEPRRWSCFTLQNWFSSIDCGCAEIISYSLSARIQQARWVPFWDWLGFRVDGVAFLYLDWTRRDVSQLWYAVQKYCSWRGKSREKNKNNQWMPPSWIESIRWMRGERYGEERRSRRPVNAGGFKRNSRKPKFIPI